MYLSAQGETLLNDLYRGFRDRYIAANPGVNENDVERAFLRKVYIGICGSISENTRIRIESIQ